MGTLPLRQTEQPEHPLVQNPIQPASRLDPVALLALGLTVLACCPASAVFGVIAGLLSYGRIRVSNGKLVGSRLAMTCAIASFVIGILSWGIGDRFQSAGRAAMNSEVRLAMDQFLTGTVDPNVWWTGVDPKALLAFQQTVRERFGPLKTGSVTQTEITLSMKSTAQFRMVLESPTIQTVASMTTDVVTDSATFLPTIRIRSIEITIPLEQDPKQTEQPMKFPPKDDSAMPDTLPK